ncbi:PAS domain S-box-containing protein [Oceanisphaera litoralis]|uniref:two-component system response regulator n=1 Tax=Oceanisphaera litoralis TaxID=225144 RepID=UPI00195BC358|nr:EAL domain-containing protein [Oceanisphaera litoralis]MBM7455279.1 PAS domain S-box-containing protein [Oceanisphaera litoralis]
MIIKPHSSKILVVDDKAENLYAMESLLKDCEVEVFLAQSGNAALSFTLHHDFALILMDVQMPEMDGFETASLIRQDEETRQIPIIFMTALNTDSRYIFQGYQSGAVDYLIKPVDSDILLSKIRVFLALDSYQHELTAMKRQYQLLLNCAGEGILGVSPSGHIQFANAAGARILGYTEQQLRGCHLHRLLFGAQEQELPHWEQSTIYMAYQDGQPYRVHDTRLWSREQQAIPAEYTSAPLKDEAGSFVGGVIVFQDISLRKQTEQKLLELAQYDPLTGLANRALFHDFLNLSIARARRRKGNMAVLLLDLDHFKDINDTLGHDTGDKLLQSVAQRIQYSLVTPQTEAAPLDGNAHLLKSVAQRLKDNLRRSDLVARLGGDEFAIVLDDISQPQDAAVVAQKILGSLAPPHQLDNYQVFISPSIGIATYPACSDEAEELVKAADTALYQAKAQGRNNYQFYAPDMHRAAMERIRLEQDLRHALRVKEQQLSLHYQPQVNLTTGNLVGIEVLLRWRHPEMGMINPARFIPLAERMGIMSELGEWIFDQACGQFQRWCQAGLLDEGVMLALNISSRQLTRDDSVSTIQAILARHGLPEHSVNLELTENTLKDELEVITQRLEQLRASGMRIALDDFGTGYSSFNQIHCLPIDSLKLAQPFVNKIGQDAKNDAVIKTIISMAHTLGFDLIAEGVETREQAAFLQEHGCDCVQGFFIHPPLSGAMMTRLLQSRRTNK